MDTKHLVLLSTLCCLTLITFCSYFGIFHSYSSPSSPASSSATPSSSFPSISSFTLRMNRFLSQLHFENGTSWRSDSNSEVNSERTRSPGTSSSSDSEVVNSVNGEECSQASARFLNNGYKRPRVGLISFPRSGNSMTRALIERVTGIWTGTDNADGDLLRYGFLGEGYTDDTVSVIKYHALRNDSRYLEAFKFDKLIYLYRNPFESFLSRMNKQAASSHNETAEYYDPELFRLKTKTRWTPLWKRHIETFVRNLTGNSMYYSASDGRYLPVLHLRYEDLDSKSANFNPQTMAEQLSRIVNFLELPHLANPQALNSKLSKHPIGTTLTRVTVSLYNRTEQDFIELPPLITKERIQCVCTPKKKTGYTPRKKTITYAVDAFPKDVQDYVIQRLRPELCLLGLTQLKPNMTVDCGPQALNQSTTEDEADDDDDDDEAEEEEEDEGEEEEEVVLEGPTTK